MEQRPTLGPNFTTRYASASQRKENPFYRRKFYAVVNEIPSGVLVLKLIEANSRGEAAIIRAGELTQDQEVKMVSYNQVGIVAGTYLHYIRVEEDRPIPRPPLRAILGSPATFAKAKD